MPATHSFPPISALSPLDGRYANKLEPLRLLMSERGYMHRRVQVELAWFSALSQLGLPEFEPLPPQAQAHVQALVANFSESDALAIKDIEAITNHDVKAVEYWLTGFWKGQGTDKHWVAGQFAGHASLQQHISFVHFACTSEDINNTAHALQLQAARAQVLLPALDGLLDGLRGMAHAHAWQPMLSRTHGQTATPTTVGKELANVVARLVNAREKVASVKLLAKMNGAVGNFNAHLEACPQIDWEAFSRRVIEQDLGLSFQPYSIQIEPHDYMAELFDAIARANTVLLDLARDMWGYISLGYFKQKLRANEVGSSTMPHKVNPIDFENAEGNLGLSNAMLRHLAEKLPISRWQRDLSDSTVLRNMGVALGYAVLGYHSLRAGLSKLELNTSAIDEDLEASWEVLTEPVQTVMRRYNLPGAYEQLKALSRGKTIGRDDLHAFIATLDLPHDAKARLLALTPASYVGLAPSLAQRI